MKLTSLPQFRRNAIRFEQIMVVLAKHGLAAWLRESDPEFLQRFLRSPEGQNLAGRPRPERIRMALAELGTTFIKLGQMLSTRADIVGADLAGELTKLQADTPADPPETVRETVENELGRPVDEIFAEFDDTPLASASIAQVHAATLEDGTAVVVKVQHAGIEEKVVNDLEILVTLAGLAEKYGRDLRLYQPVRVVTEFREHAGQGWGVIAKNLGIKPGSAEFHALKNGRLPARGQDGSMVAKGHGKSGKGKK